MPAGARIGPVSALFEPAAAGCPDHEAGYLRRPRPAAPLRGRAKLARAPPPKRGRPWLFSYLFTSELSSRRIRVDDVNREDDFRRHRHPIALSGRELPLPDRLQDGVREHHVR